MLRPFFAQSALLRVHRVIDLEGGCRRVCTDVDGAVIGFNSEQCIAEVQQQRIGRCVVGAHWFAVNGLGIDGLAIEKRIVYNEITPDMGDATATELFGEEPEAFDHKPGITAPAQNQITLESIAVHLATHE